MKRHCTLIAVSLMLALCASASYAIFPGIRPGVIGDGTTQVELRHGWWSPTPVPPGAFPTAAWYHCFATSDPNIARQQALVMEAKLKNAIFPSTPTMYVVTNFSNSGPVFSASPHPLGLAGYSGLWALIYVTWLPTATPHVITNAFVFNAVTNPTGLPPITEAVYSTTVGGPNIGAPPIIVAPVPHVVMDCPIFAIGNISSPWFKPTSFAPPYIYRIPQGRSLNYFHGQLLTIPFWRVYCRNDITKAISVRRVVIPDSSDGFIAALIGANLAPTLALVPWVSPQPTPAGGKSTMYVINWNQLIAAPPPVPVVKVLQNQYPVLDACPTACVLNGNLNYSSVNAFVLLNRNLGLISPEVLFNNWEFVAAMITAGRLVPVAPYVYPPVAAGPAVNAPLLCDAPT